MISLMQNYRYAVLGLCGIAIFIGVYRLLSPNAFKTQLMVVSEFFVIAFMIFPLFNGVGFESLQFEGSDFDFRNDETYSLFQAQEIERDLKPIILEKLQAEGINPIGIGIDITVEENEIIIKKADVIIEEEQKIPSVSIKEKIIQYLGFPVEFKVKDGD
ncbi:MAG: hypothetical protein RSB05_07880 [Clostridiales bacterium]